MGAADFLPGCPSLTWWKSLGVAPCHDHPACHHSADHAAPLTSAPRLHTLAGPGSGARRGMSHSSILRALRGLTPSASRANAAFPARLRPSAGCAPSSISADRDCRAVPSGRPQWGPKGGPPRGTLGGGCSRRHHSAAQAAPRIGAAATHTRRPRWRGQARESHSSLPREFRGITPLTSRPGSGLPRWCAPSSFSTDRGRRAVPSGPPAVGSKGWPTDVGPLGVAVQ